MPHNRTRIWAGLAIAAIAIPAVGQYYYSSATHDLQGNPIAGRANLESRQQDSFGSGRISMRQSDRDYQAEVDAAIARKGGQIPKNPATRGTDPLFQTRPLEVPVPTDSPVRVASNRAPVNSASTADIDPSLDSLDNTPPDSGGLSDRAVYDIVADNLSAEDRDTFEKSWALMSAQERADMLDQFRANLQSK